MQLLILILKKVDFVNDLIRALAQGGVHGGTIIDSTGMANVLGNLDDLPMFSMLRKVINDEDGTKESCKTMLFVLKDEDVQKTRQIIRNVLGDLSQPNTAVMFSVPVTFVEGLGETL
ncbi:MAG: hypothetical protein PHR92_14915 [Lachnospiraceae bacterium]|nr:hypothetical protein [Lachnospiraceae bacterium]